MQVKFTHNQNQIFTFSGHDHLGWYFPPPQHQFSPKKHPPTVVKAQDKYCGPAQQLEKHVFEIFDNMFK